MKPSRGVLKPCPLCGRFPAGVISHAEVERDLEAYMKKSWEEPTFWDLYVVGLAEGVGEALAWVLVSVSRCLLYMANLCDKHRTEHS